MEFVNVFGKPVTGSNRLDAARKAYQDPNAEGKKDAALAYVRSQKHNFGHGVSTLCIFYNATGRTLTYQKDVDIYGKIYESDTYPLIVQNGQWGAFLHIKSPAVASGSVAYVIYRGKCSDTEYCHQLLGWDNPWNQVTQNTHAYCDILDDGSYPTTDDVYNAMEAGKRQKLVNKKSMLSIATIEDDTTSLYVAILATEDL